MSRVNSGAMSDIGKPSILNVEWDMKKIKVKWEEGKSAIKHFLKVMSGGNIVLAEELTTTKKQTTQSYSFDMNEYYGKILNFVIDATGEGSKTQKSEKCVLIGGDYAVKNVVANKDYRNSRRNIIVLWQSPNTPPQSYKIKVQEVKVQQSWRVSEKLILVDEISAVEQTQTSYKFTELKMDTEYYFEVAPIYGIQLFDGSISNRIKTDKRIQYSVEVSPDFGKPEKLIHETMAILHNSLSVELSWSRVYLSENYKLKSYHVELKQRGTSYNSSIFNKEIDSNKAKVMITDVKTGYVYDVKFTTYFVDLDTKKVYTAVKDYSFPISPSETKIHDCSWVNGVVNFSWEPVNGVKKYQLVIRDELLQKNLVFDKINKVNPADDGCQVKVQMTNELCIGRVCMTKLIAYTDNNLTSETDWKAHLIGGDFVPRNVKAVANTENPERCINITFDAPHKGQADEYIIEAKPTEKGRTKKMSSKSNSVTFEYLRKGVEYKFFVYATHNTELSVGSPSNAIMTEGDNIGALMNFAFSRGNYDMTNSVFSGITKNTNVTMGDDFGKVRDLEEKITSNQHNDSVTLSWKIPSFDNKSNDYKVEHYEVKIRKQNDNEAIEVMVLFIKGQYEYFTKSYDLELGHTYDISVATLYDDIDKDVTHISSAVKKLVYTRPCKPKIVSNIDDKNNELRLEWNDVQGALRYEVDIYTENPQQPLFHQDNNKKIIWKRAFDETFGYGTSYKAVITAVGAGNKTNSSETSTKTIGGELVPTNVKATINEEKVTDPNTQVFLTWEQPEEVPNRYKVFVDNKEINEKNTKFVGLSCLVSDLKAGTDYLFKVVGVHTINNKEVVSGGCFSNKIQTNPTPTQVKNLFGKLGEDPSTMVHIAWDKVDAERPYDSTNYRVCVTTEDEKYYREIYVTTEEVLVTGLEPATTYVCTVAGGNSLGYGRNSEAYKITTKFGTPKRVQLSAKDNSTSNSLTLSFLHAEGNAEQYIAVMYKHQDTVKHQVIGPVAVESGYIFESLDFNSIYSVKVHGVFATGEGDACWSNKYTTAPSRTKITEACCTINSEGNLSSRQINIKWKSDSGCNEHQILIKRGRYSVIESRLTVENTNELVYSCLYKATQYQVEVRSKNRQCFGEWSELAIVDLAPSKLENVTASLEEKGNHIVVQCGIAGRVCPFYFVQAYCNGVLEGNPFEVHSNADTNVFEVNFIPKVPAEKYHFLMWGENSGKVRGKASCTETVLSRPDKGKVPVAYLNDENPSTEIQIKWRAQTRCEKYELRICCADQNKPENILIFDTTSCKYKCQCPGSKYKVAVRSICGTVKGHWSGECEIILAPSKVKLLEDDCQDPVRLVAIKWEPLKHKPQKYVVKLFEGQKELATEETNETEVRFEGIAKPGSLCYCTVTAIGDNKTIGRMSKSKHYRIMWSKPSYFTITPDVNNLSQCANIRWENPYGVNCFKLQIENNQTGVSSEILLENDNYAYRSGIPGNRYTVRLYCGCDSRYDLDFSLETMIMKPEAPTDIVITPNGDIHGFIVEFKDKTSQRKKYEVTAEPLSKTLKMKSIETCQHKAVLRDLIDGESYSINVTAIVDNTKSEAAMNEGYVKTLPKKIQNLESDFDETLVAVIFKWDALKIEPDEYKVQWRVGNDTITEDSTHEPKFEIRFVKPAHCYSIRVAATNESGCGKLSQWETFITVPGTVCNLKSRFDGEKNIVVEWDPLDIEPDGYKFQWRIGDEKITEEITSTYRFTIDCPTPGQKYSARVAAFNKTGCGKMSDWGSIGTEGNSTNKQSQRNTMSCDKQDPVSFRSDPDTGDDSKDMIKLENGKIYFNRYDQIREESKVFRARRVAAMEEDERVVVKIVKISQILDDIAMYEREVDHMRLASRHPNVVKYYGSGNISYERKECIYIVMEECESETVFEKMKNKVSYAKRKFDVKGMAAGLSHIHGHRILHRDLKPQNVLYKDGIVVISDFGLSKRLAPGKTNTHKSRSDAGTDGWRAPETSGCKGVTSIYADVFSAGLVMYYILTNGQHPYGKKPHCWQTYIEDDTGMSLQTLYETPDSNIAIDLITSMLQIDPKTRPTMIEVLGHPFFWSDQRRLEFYGDVMKGMELLKKINERKNCDGKNGNDAPHLFLDDVQSDDMYADKVKSDLKKWEEKDISFTGDELNEIQSRYTEKKVPVVVEKDAMKRKAKRFGNTVTELLRFIRNRHTHDHEDKGEGSFDMTIEEFWKFFFDRFPFFFLYIYYKAKKYFENKSKEDEYYSDTMARYFLKSSDTDFEGLC